MSPLNFVIFLLFVGAAHGNGRFRRQIQPNQGDVVFGEINDPNIVAAVEAALQNPPGGIVTIVGANGEQQLPSWGIPQPAPGQQLFPGSFPFPNPWLTGASTPPIQMPGWGHGGLPGSRPGGFTGPRPGGFPGPIPGGFPGPMPGGFPGSRPDGFPGQRPGGYPGPRPGSFPGQRPGGYPGPRPGGFSGPRPGGYPGPRPGGFPGQRPGGYPGPRPGGFPGQLLEGFLENFLPSSLNPFRPNFQS